MIPLKSQREISIMRDAGKIVAECHAALAEAVKPGVTTRELDEMVETMIRSHGATPSFKGFEGFPTATCMAVNEVICHGFPDDEPLKEGDIVTIDIGAFYKGYHGDRGWTYAVGEVSEEVRKLMEVTEKCLFLGIEQAVPGNRVGDIGHAIQSYAEGLGYGVVREFTGHGVGQGLHEDPMIPHFGPPGTGLRLREGMVIAIEPMITTGDWHAVVDDNGWTARTADGSLCAQYEHSLAITKDGPVILTVL